MNSKRLVVLLAVVFALTITVLTASADYVVLKDKNGVCRVIESDHKTPATIAGPFKTKEEAQKAKAKECPKTSDSDADKIKEKAKEKVEGAKSSAEQLKEKAKEKIEGAKSSADKIKEKAKEKVEGAKSAAEKVKEKIKDAVPADKK